MKNNLLVTILNWILATSLILSLIFAYQFFSRTKELRTISGNLQLQQAQAQQRVMPLNMLINDLLEYSKKNPKINPVLESAGLRLSGTNSQSTAR